LCSLRYSQENFHLYWLKLPVSMPENQILDRPLVLNLLKISPFIPVLFHVDSWTLKMYIAEYSFLCVCVCVQCSALIVNQIVGLSWSIWWCMQIFTRADIASELSSVRENTVASFTVCESCRNLQQRAVHMKSIVRCML
jgi:hypothetical protein